MSLDTNNSVAEVAVWWSGSRPKRRRLVAHGLLELQTHHAGVDDQGQGDQDHVMAGDA